jgi:hypothetical protein
MELQESEISIGLLILIKSLEREQKDIILRVIKLLFFQDVLLYYVLTDKLELELFVILTKIFVFKKNIFLKINHLNI